MNVEDPKRHRQPRMVYVIPLSRLFEIYAVVLSAGICLGIVICRIFDYLR